MTKQILVKDIPIGGGAPITVQSMTNVPTKDVTACLAQIERLKNVGCDIVRLSVPDRESAFALREITDRSPLPVVADIHNDYKMAILSAENGAHKLRINPSNIGNQSKVRLVVDAAKDAGIPIRIGVNGGSIEKDLVEKYGYTPKAMAESCLKSVALLESFGFYDLVLSVKFAGVAQTVEAYRYLSRVCDYPLHIGVTEAGTPSMGEVKSAIGIGALLLDGIGDTLRVSLTDKPENEVIYGHRILRAVGLKSDYVEVISCPTCARTACDVQGIANRVEELVKNIRIPLKIAVMGCTVNGVGEGKQADIGIAGGKNKSILFENGNVIETVENDFIFERLALLIDKKIKEKRQ